MAEFGESRVDASEVLAQIEVLLDRVHPDRSGLDPRAWLEVVRVARRVSSRIDAFASVVLAEADAAEASMPASRTPLSSWLGLQATMSKRRRPERCTGPTSWPRIRRSVRLPRQAASGVVKPVRSAGC